MEPDRVFLYMRAEDTDFAIAAIKALPNVLFACDQTYARGHGLNPCDPFNAPGNLEATVIEYGKEPAYRFLGHRHEEEKRVLLIYPHIEPFRQKLWTDKEAFEAIGLSIPSKASSTIVLPIAHGGLGAGFVYCGTKYVVMNRPQNPRLPEDWTP